MGKPAQALKLLDVLKPEAVILNIQGTEKAEAIIELTNLVLSAEPDPVRGEIVGALLEREKIGSTGIGSGVAVPHAKSTRVTRMVCAFGISNQGIAFEALDGEPVFILFLLVAPPNSQSEHLNILARIVRLLKDRSFRESLRQAKSESEVLRLIAAGDL